jgi:hypothetical protein
MIDSGWLFTVAGCSFGVGVLVGGYVYRWSERARLRGQEQPWVTDCKKDLKSRPLAVPRQK